MVTLSIASRYISSCNVGASGYETSGHVFGESSVDADYLPSPTQNLDNSEYKSKLTDLVNKNIPSIIYNILSKIGDSSREMAGVGGYTIMSVDEILRRNNMDATFVDFGTCYMGMGHRNCVAWRKSDEQCFIRAAGGSNSWEQMYTEEVTQSLNADTGDFCVTKFKYENINGVSTRKESICNKKTVINTFTAEEFFLALMDSSTVDEFDIHYLPLEQSKLWI